MKTFFAMLALTLGIMALAADWQPGEIAFVQGLGIGLTIGGVALLSTLGLYKLFLRWHP